jgi:hypothetical protein
VSRRQAPPLALREVIESEIRAIARREGVDGHRQCLRKFLELLLARGARALRPAAQPSAVAAARSLRALRQREGALQTVLCAVASSERVPRGRYTGSSCVFVARRAARTAPAAAALLRRLSPARLRAGVISQSQVLLSFGVVAELFNGVRDVSHRPEPYHGAPGPSAAHSVCIVALSSPVFPGRI